MPSTAQNFLRELDKKLWTAADKLRSNLDAAVCSLAERDRSRSSGTRRGDAGSSINHAVLGNLSVYGQDQWAWGAHLRRAKRTRRVRLRRKQPNQSNPTTWRLATMNMAKSLPRQSETATGGIDFNFGKEPANSFTNDQHPDLRSDYVMANPPFNIKEWWDGKLEGDARWKYGTPPQGNANFAWVQHMLHHLAPNGSMALLLANGSMSSNSDGEGDIRRALIEADLVETATRECASLKSEGTPQVARAARDNMVALPGQLFDGILLRENELKSTPFLLPN